MIALRVLKAYSILPPRRLVGGNKNMKHRKKMLIGALLITISLVSIISPASAYTYNGRYWHSGFAQVDKDSSIPSSWSNSLTQAMSAWNNAGANFFFYQIGCENKLYYTSLGSSGPLATTTETYSGTSMTKCIVRFNSDKSWSTTGASGYFDVQSAATHEFGHWLSLGHSSNTEATMYSTMSTGETKKRSLHSDDIAGICYIYP